MLAVLYKVHVILTYSMLLTLNTVMPIKFTAIYVQYFVKSLYLKKMDSNLLKCTSYHMNNIIYNVVVIYLIKRLLVYRNLQPIDH